MTEPLENLYFNWLYAKVAYTDVKTPSTTYYRLFSILQQIEFVFIISGDDNRAEDGKELRREFLIAGDFPDDLDWRHLVPCSVLEMLIAFSYRAADMTDGSHVEWFWEFLDNLGFRELNDSADFTPQDIEERIDIFMWRRYESTGYGGLFPLREAPEDQTSLQIWYQFCRYLVDQQRLE